MCRDVTYTAGKHGLLVGAYYGPRQRVITESQLADIEIMPEVSQAERVNTIKGHLSIRSRAIPKRISLCVSQ